MCYTHTHHPGWYSDGLALAKAMAGEGTPQICVPNPRLGIQYNIGPGKADQCMAEGHHSCRRSEGREKHIKMFYRRICYTSYRPPTPHAEEEARSESDVVVPANRPDLSLVPPIVLLKCCNSIQKCEPCVCWRECRNKVVSLPIQETARGLISHFASGAACPPPLP